jgi:hypothetical protein
MEITITFEQGCFAVRTDAGIFQSDFETMDSAAIYANGLADGYNAAKSKLGKASGFRTDASAHRQLGKQPA